MEKYGKESFNDPVLRCDSCRKLVLRSTLHRLGKCPCGNRKVREVHSVDSEEVVWMQTQGIDPEFIACFAPVPDEEVSANA